MSKQNGVLFLFFLNTHLNDTAAAGGEIGDKRILHWLVEKARGMKKPLQLALLGLTCFNLSLALNLLLQSRANICAVRKAWPHSSNEANLLDIKSISSKNPTIWLAKDTKKITFWPLCFRGTFTALPFLIFKLLRTYNELTWNLNHYLHLKGQIRWLRKNWRWHHMGKLWRHRHFSRLRPNWSNLGPDSRHVVHNSYLLLHQ